MQYWILAVVALSGAGLAVETAANTRLREAIQSPILGALFCNLIGAAGLAVLLLSGYLGRGKLSLAFSAPWWAWLGGFLGAFSVVASILGLQKVGAGSVVSWTVFGQLLMGLLLDSFGWLNVERIPMNGWRIAGAILLAAGACLLQKR